MTQTIAFGGRVFLVGYSEEGMSDLYVFVTVNPANDSWTILLSMISLKATTAALQN